MMTMCPPEPREDWDRILELLDVEQGYLKQVQSISCILRTQNRSR